MYKIIRFILFQFDPEKTHYFSMNIFRILCSVKWIRKLLNTIYQPPYIHQPVKIFGLTFKNGIGLAAGFDKNARYLTVLETLGFSHVEIGTVTPLPQYGNNKPRLFRLPTDKALINRMGFNNDGAETIAGRLKKWRALQQTSTPRLIIGGNIGKNKDTPNEQAWQDYAKCFEALFAYVDYFVINVSSPNTPGLRILQEEKPLSQIVMHLRALNQKKSNPKPLLLKISPDLTTEQIDVLIRLSLANQLDGLIVANTTTSREHLQASNKRLDAIGAGGLSGIPIRKKSTDLLAYIHSRVNNRIVLIASGGIFTAANAKEKFSAGAALAQIWTGFIYEGPAIVKKICAGFKNNM